MKITVIGAGAIGSAITRDLCSRDDVEQVQVCDARARALQQLHETTDNKKLRSFQVDVRDQNVLEPILAGSNCVIGAATPEVNTPIAETCISIGSHFCGLGGSDELVRKQLDLDERAASAGVWVVPNCGLAPGLVNIICMHGVDQFDHVKIAKLRVGDVPLHPKPPFNFRISWAAEKVIDDYTHPVVLIRDGKIVEKEPLTGLEPIRFREPFAAMEAFRTAGGLSTLAADLEGKIDRLDHKSIRWPGHAAQMAFLLGLGFGDNRSVDVLTHLTYRDILARQLRQRLGGRYEDAVLLRVLIRGTIAGEKKTLVYEMTDLFDEQLQMSAMRRCVSIATTAIAIMVASGVVEGGGAAPPERILPRQDFIDAVISRGLAIESNWYDGHVGLNQLPEATTA